LLILAPSIGSLSSELEERFPGLQECRDKIAALIENVAESNISHDSHSLPDDEFDAIDVLLSDIESTPRFQLSGCYSQRVKDEIKAISQEYNYPVHFDMDTPVLSAIPKDDPSITLYTQKSDEIMQLLEQHSVGSYYVSLYSSMLGTTVVIGGDIDRLLKDRILDVLKNTPFHPLFSQPIELHESGRQKLPMLPMLEPTSETLQPGCSISLENNMTTRTLGCVLTDGMEDVGITVGHCVFTLDECSSRLRAKGIFTSSAGHAVIHHHGNVIANPGATPSTDPMGDVIIENQLVDSEEKFKTHAEGGTRDIGTTKMTVRGFAKDDDQRPCILDYSIFNLHSDGRHNNTVADNPETNEFQLSPSGNVAPLYSGCKVIKVGRASGLTRGTVNQVKSTVKIAGLHMTTWEWTVVGEDGLPWAKRGDEGSSVWDEDGNLNGILWGVIPTEGSGLVTPISEILGSLAHFTGKYYRVKVPREGIPKLKSPSFLPGTMADKMTQRDETAVELSLVDDEMKQYFQEDDVSGIVGNSIQG
jgi:hypothetical protein